MTKAQTIDERLQSLRRNCVTQYKKRSRVLYGHALDCTQLVDLWGATVKPYLEKLGTAKALQLLDLETTETILEALEDHIACPIIPLSWRSLFHAPHWLALAQRHWVQSLDFTPNRIDSPYPEVKCLETGWSATEKVTSWRAEVPRSRNIQLADCIVWL